MKPETQTREKLLEAAKKEFMEKGYAKASLRNICKQADVTTGALYFFFQGKEDLFGSLVEEPLNQMLTFMKQHYEGEIQELDKFPMEKYDFTDDSKLVLMIVSYMFQYHDSFVFLLTKANGSKYENCTDEFVKLTEAHYRILADKMSLYFKTDRIDDSTIHWFAHLQIFSFVQLITHNITREDAVKQMDTIVKFMISGWFGIYKQ